MLCYVFSVMRASGRGEKKRGVTDTHTEHRAQTEELTQSHNNSHIALCKKEVLKSSVSCIIENRIVTLELKVELNRRLGESQQP